MSYAAKRKLVFVFFPNKLKNGFSLTGSRVKSNKNNNDKANEKKTQASI